MRTIRQEDLIASVADALQYISYYHPVDYIEALGEAYEAEQSPAAKDAIAQILTNSRMCAEGHRPICQDTGIVVAFVRVGMDVRFGRRDDVGRRHDQRGRAARVQPSRQPAARLDPRRSRPAGARTPGTTRRRSSTSTSFRATRSTCGSRRRAAAARTSRSSRC